jgi:hypothetical protein
MISTISGEVVTMRVLSVGCPAVSRSLKTFFLIFLLPSFSLLELQEL